jgi:hypothetical protein
MNMYRSNRALTGWVLLLGCACTSLTVRADTPGPSCAVESKCSRVVPTDPARCLALEAKLKSPGAFVSGNQIRLNRYEPIVTEWMQNFCYRRLRGDVYEWAHDATARDTGPTATRFENGKFVSAVLGTHVVARVWYSPEMHDWMLANRPADEGSAPANPPPVPDGAIMVKEMWPAPRSLYNSDCFDCMEPGSSGAVVFVRDSKSFATGWFAGWWGKGGRMDWPAASSNPLTSMGDGGQGFCMNCHGSTVSGNTFASINTIDGHPATFVTQLAPMSTFDPTAEEVDHHRENAIPLTKLVPVDQALPAANAEFLATFGSTPVAASHRLMFAKNHAEPVPPANMPSQTYDSVLIAGQGPLDHFLSSTQCVGCHQANGTGLQLDMLDFTPGPLGDYGDGKPVNIAPYSQWRSSPMGLAGRDPIFYSQLESEQILHADLNSGASPKAKAATRAVIQDTCLQCHGNMGQRQRAIDRHAASGSCGQFSRDDAKVVPFPNDDAGWSQLAHASSYAGLARDGISCTSCHQLALNEEAEKYADAPWNVCITQKQKSLNPAFTGFAATFSGSFPVGSAEDLSGPYADPLLKPMANSLRVVPKHNADIQTSEVCGSCHSIHLPVLDHPQPESECLAQTDPPDPFRCFAKRYEQTTYPEWVFSAYRTGKLGALDLPAGPGATPTSCQQCHMPSTDSAGKPLRSKIAAIEEYSNYPQTDYRLPAAEIDLPQREHFALHQLVGLNFFLIEMAQQFPQVLGIRSDDPGVSGMAVPPLQVTENAMVDQASKHTAELAVVPKWNAQTGVLSAEVSVDNLAGHKFPSGVSFRRAFVEFKVEDALGKLVWASGRSNGAGTLVDQRNQPVAGEFWWKTDCSERLPNAWQPHYQSIDSQNQVQIYQELITDAKGMLTTSFLGINAHPKDNRLQPHGFLPEAQRIAIAAALGDKTPVPMPGAFPMDENLGVAVGPEGRAANDPDYQNGSGMDRLTYVVRDLKSKPARISATLYYQSIPPFYQQDRYCTAAHARGTPIEDTQRLHYLAANLDLKDTHAEDWRLQVTGTGWVKVE